MKCVYTLTVTITTMCLCNTITYKPRDIKLPHYPTDHIVENYMAKRLKSLLNGLSIYASTKPPDPEPTSALLTYTTTPVPLYAKESQEECMKIVRINLNSCIIETTSPKDLQDVQDWWTPGNDSKLMKELEDYPYMDVYAVIPKCLQKCMTWAIGAQHKCKMSHSRRRLKGKVGMSNADKHKKNNVLTVYEIHPKFIDRDRKRRPYWDISHIDASSLDSTNIDEKEVTKILCVFIAGHLLDVCIKGIVDAECLEQLKSDWTTNNIELVMKMLLTEEINEFEDFPAELKNCLMQAKYDFNQCTLLEGLE